MSYGKTSKHPRVMTRTKVSETTRGYLRESYDGRTTDMEEDPMVTKRRRPPAPPGPKLILHTPPGGIPAGTPKAPVPQCEVCGKARVRRRTSVFCRTCALAARHLGWSSAFARRMAVVLSEQTPQARRAEAG